MPLSRRAASSVDSEQFRSWRTSPTWMPQRWTDLPTGSSCSATDPLRRLALRSSSPPRRISTRVRLLWSEAGAVCNLGFCASLDRLKGSSPLRSWVFRPGREKGAVPGVCAAARGTRQGCSAGPGSCSSRWWRAGGPGHAASSTTYGSRTITHWHDQVTPEEPDPIWICARDERLWEARQPHSTCEAAEQGRESGCGGGGGKRGLGEGNTVRR